MKLALEVRVKEILAEVLLVDESELTPGADLANDLGADSLDMAEISMKIEDEILDTDKPIASETLDQWVTVQHIVDSVQKLAPAWGHLKKAHA